MRKATHSLMRKISPRVERLVNLELLHCGRDEDVAKADRYRIRMLQFIASEIDKLAVKAGVE